MRSTRRNPIYERTPRAASSLGQSVAPIRRPASHISHCAGSSNPQPLRGHRHNARLPRRTRQGRDQRRGACPGRRGRRQAAVPASTSSRGTQQSGRRSGPDASALAWPRTQLSCCGRRTAACPDDAQAELREPDVRRRTAALMRHRATGSPRMQPRGRRERCRRRGVVRASRSATHGRAARWPTPPGGDSLNAPGLRWPGLPPRGAPISPAIGLRWSCCLRESDRALAAAELGSKRADRLKSDGRPEYAPMSEAIVGTAAGRLASEQRGNLSDRDFALVVCG